MNVVWVVIAVQGFGGFPYAWPPPQAANGQAPPAPPQTPQGKSTPLFLVVVVVVVC
jgi:hypothetical protein